MARKLITLTTDLGLTDHYVASLKGFMHAHLDDITLIDISHEVAPFDVVAGANLLNWSYKDFPEGSVHIVGIDSEPVINFGPNNGSFPSILVMDGHYFVSNDNGFFGALVGQRRDFKFYRIDHVLSNPKAFTFPTKNILAKAAIELLQGKKVDEIGSEEEYFKTALNPEPIIEDKVIKGHIIHIDSYGNAITNVSKELFERERKDAQFTLYFKSKRYFIDEISKSYNSVIPGERVAIFNERDLLEIAINRAANRGTGGANKLFGLMRGDLIRIEFTSPGSHNTIDDLFS